MNNTMTNQQVQQIEAIGSAIMQHALGEPNRPHLKPEAATLLAYQIWQRHQRDERGVMYMARTTEGDTWNVSYINRADFLAHSINDFQPEARDTFRRHLTANADNWLLLVIGRERYTSLVLELGDLPGGEG